MSAFVGPIIPQSYEITYLRELTRRLETRLNSDFQIHEVTDADMSNSWVNDSVAHQVKYWRDNSGMVHLSGILKAGGSGLRAFTLPADYRPVLTTDAYFAVPENAKFAVIHIDSAGIVIPTTTSPATLCALDGVHFKAEL